MTVQESDFTNQDRDFCKFTAEEILRNPALERITQLIDDKHEAKAIRPVIFYLLPQEIRDEISIHALSGPTK